MKLLTMVLSGALAAAACFGAWPGVASAQQRLVVEEGPLTPECPFGICPVTNQPRTARDFYQLFGYLPKSAGNFPGIPTSPPPNWPKTYYTPRPGTTNTAASSTSSSGARPPANTITRPAAQKAPTQPVANRGTSRLAQLTKEDAARMRTELQGQNGKLLDDLTARLDTAPGGAAAPRTVAARAALEGARARVNDGTLRNADLVALVAALRGVVADDILRTVGQVAVNQQVFAWLQAAQIGANQIPVGGNVPIALIPGLQAGMIIPLGFGPALVGMGRQIDTIILGEGNVLQAAGLPAPDGPPLADNEKPLAVGSVILTNVGEGAVNYTVNGTQFAMQPRYSQNLDAGRSWTVAFDRGGGNGTAQYQVEPGWYEFTETPKGWELFRKSFDIRLENNNDFDFQYVVGDQARTLAAGRTEQFVGEYPTVLRFDDATGKIKHKRLTEDRYHVAVTADGALEIYPASSVPAPPKPDLFVGAAPATAPGAAPTADSSAPAPRGFTLPAGFTALDPFELLAPAAETRVAARIPPAFTMFAAATGDANDK